MSIEQFIEKMPKVELHVHLEGSIRAETLIKLAQKNQVDLPAKSIEDLHQWYTFTDFPHFIEIYRYFARCLRSAEDIELITREFLIGQAKQHILYSEVTYTPYSQYLANHIPFEEQLAAITSARSWASQALGVEMGLVLDISRDVTPQEGCITAEWAVGSMDKGVVALGLGGNEIGNPPEKFVKAFQIAQGAGLPAVPHAGETGSADSIWGALNALHAVRIGHGVRCLEDAALVERLRAEQIPLEICPTSNVCLKVVSNLAEHPLPQLMQNGLMVTINSDDPPMFNTTLSREYQQIAATFAFTQDQIEAFVLNALQGSFLPDEQKKNMRNEFRSAFQILSAGNSFA
jgi:adenosine deaminase